MVAGTFLPSSKIVKKPLKYAYSENPKTLGEHIRKKRIESHQTQSEVASLIGVDVDTITTWETARYKPQVRHYPAIIFFLGYYPFDHERESNVGKMLFIRYCYGWSRKQLAKVLDTDVALIRLWETKKKPVNPKYCDKLLDLFSKNPCPSA